MILGTVSKNDIIKAFENSDYDTINKTKLKKIMKPDAAGEIIKILKQFYSFQET